MVPKLPPIPVTERTSLVTTLLDVIDEQREEIRRLEEKQKQLEGENEQLEVQRKQVEIEKKRLEADKKRLEGEVRRFRERLAEYEPGVWSERNSASNSEKPSRSYSMNAETKRRQKHRRRKKSPGRRPTEVKFSDAARTESVYPEGFEPEDCRLVRERAVWRLENGKAVLIGYRVYAGPDGEAAIPGVTPRCEYGIEILVVLAFVKYIIGLSLGKACAVMDFFCGLKLSKSEADALLRQLANHWCVEYETLCELIAHAAVVSMDETGWKVGNENCSLWLFASSLHRVFLFGCRKDAATLDKMLPPDVFKGIGVSDDEAVYSGRFRESQKCWAHLLRKLIRLALLHPRKTTYQRLLDDLLTLYRDAKRAAEDERLGEAGREQKVSEFEGRVCDLFQPYWPCETTPEMKPHERDFTNFVNEIMRLCLAEELFTFVRVPEVEPTNNARERDLRNPAMDRKAGRTNQTPAGARRRSVIVSVLESLRANLEQFTFTSVINEVTHWMTKGVSLFQKQWRKLMQTQPAAAPNSS
jgi:transposase